MELPPVHTPKAVLRRTGVGGGLGEGVSGGARDLAVAEPTAAPPLALVAAQRHCGPCGPAVDLPYHVGGVGLGGTVPRRRQPARGSGGYLAAAHPPSPTKSENPKRRRGDVCRPPRGARRGCSDVDPAAVTPPPPQRRSKVPSCRSEPQIGHLGGVWGGMRG
jgi:hypothetical protein